MMDSRSRATTSLLVVLVFVAPGYAAPKTDVVELLNGDRVTADFQLIDPFLVRSETRAFFWKLIF